MLPWKIHNSSTNYLFIFALFRIFDLISINSSCRLLGLLIYQQTLLLIVLIIFQIQY